jgi:hypothetical protein
MQLHEKRQSTPYTLSISQEDIKIEKEEEVIRRDFHASTVPGNPAY